MSKENPQPISILCNKLNLPKAPKIPRGTNSRNRSLYFKLKAERNKIIKLRLAELNKYKCGTYKDYEGDGYFKIPLYLYHGEYYA